MALKFANKNGGSEKASAKPEPSKPASGKSPFMKGAAAKSAMKKEEEKVASYGKTWRFRIPFKTGQDNETQITFLDGELDENGILDIPFAREHTVKKDGNWQNIICTEDAEGYCPICAASEDSTPALVGYLSVLDHTEYTDKQGNQHSMTKRLFVAKRSTLQLLTKMAEKRGGLTGITFDVSRTGDREPAVGNVFDFIQKDDLEEMRQENGWKAEDIVPLNYDEELSYYTADQLAEMGFGPKMNGPGSQSSSIDEDALSDQM